MFKKNIKLNTLTTLKIGGSAEFFCEATTEEELFNMVEEARHLNVSINVLGGGSNVLVSDDGVAGVVIKNSICKRTQMTKGESVFLTVGAGEVFDDVVAYTVAEKWWGLENLSYIPGSVGATPVQNVGAYGVEVADIIYEVRVLNTMTMEFETLTPQQCEFGYRDSIFKKNEGKKYIVTSVTFKLSTQAVPQLSYKDLVVIFKDEKAPIISDIRDALIEIRSSKFPDWTQVGTAGSFFKNPIIHKTLYEKILKDFPNLPGFYLEEHMVKLPLAWVLDKICNMRGLKSGNVGTYEGQALVLVHNGQATAHEITKFATHIQDTVFEKIGIKIEWEVTRLK